MMNLRKAPHRITVAPRCVITGTIRMTAGGKNVPARPCSVPPIARQGIGRGRKFFLGRQECLPHQGGSQTEVFS